MLSKEKKKEFRETADDFLNSIKEIVNVCYFLEDTEKLYDLVHQVDMVMGYPVLKRLKEKGFSKEITALCDKAGRVGENK